MKWITRSHVHVDRVACPWLITRFIDNEAEFLFVPANQIEKVVKETGAIPFDAPDVKLGHHENCCSFKSIILKQQGQCHIPPNAAVIRAERTRSLFEFRIESGKRVADNANHNCGVVKNVSKQDRAQRADELNRRITQ